MASATPARGISILLVMVAMLPRMHGVYIVERLSSAVTQRLLMVGVIAFARDCIPWPRPDFTLVLPLVTAVLSCA